MIKSYDKEQLNNQWSIYEKYQAADQKFNLNYNESIVKIAQFATVEELAYLLKNTIYAKITDIFSDPFELKIKQFKRFNAQDDKLVQIDALGFFKDSIHPSWEDEKNKMGADIQFELPKDGYDNLNEIYKQMILEIFAMDAPYKHIINGIRIVDKLYGKYNSHVRFEIWTNVHLDTPKNVNPNAAEYIQQVESLVSGIYTRFGLTKLNFKMTIHGKA